MANETKKIWVTLPDNIIDAIEVISEEIHGGSRNKADTIKEMLNIYIDTQKTRLKEYGAYSKIITALKGKEYNDTYMHKIDYLEDYIAKFNVGENFKQQLFDCVKNKDEEGIESLYVEARNSIKYSKDTEFERKIVQDYLDKFGFDGEIYLDFMKSEHNKDIEATKKLYNKVLELMKEKK